MSVFIHKISDQRLFERILSIYLLCSVELVSKPADLAFSSAARTINQWMFYITGSFSCGLTCSVPPKIHPSCHLGASLKCSSRVCFSWVNITCDCRLGWSRNFLNCCRPLNYKRWQTSGTCQSERERGREEHELADV